jgi:transcriptional regulator with XRE-family HTH domain
MEGYKVKGRKISVYLSRHLGEYTPAALARAIGCTPRHVYDLLAGDRSPSAELIDKIAVVLKLNRFYLYYLAGKWPEELGGLSLDEFQKQFGLGLEPDIGLAARERELLLLTP